MENKDFVEWATEHVVVVVAHNDKGHDPAEEKDEKGEPVKVCPLYPGLTCEQHQDAMRDMQNPAEGFPKFPAVEGVPASFFVTPSGELRRLEGADQQSAGKTTEIGDEMLKELDKATGDHMTWKKWEKVQEAFTEGDAAVEKADWKAALKAYGEVDKLRKKAPEALVQQLDQRFATLNEKLQAAWTEIKDGSAEPKEKTKAANDLLGKIRVTLSTGPLPLKAEIEAWIKANKPAK